ncbi:hypothetical protein H310_07035 [Aphanomyces invadans]|uniref:Uncharacterized protein n=1 Tax=Aphanomyces invadans TaxID=157072 RepID=A0A024U3F7_9STRA|nr:hypothetical protein H310_07035 [Aphanomyces invadans]ETW00397.1 hypothetical protein H310_07035 [Aphanomyces invadans]|eukprot:XP_008870532.1 hypothetical protein H310_07035 [Aphanomyces invadans]
MTTALPVDDSSTLAKYDVDGSDVPALAPLLAEEDESSWREFFDTHIYAQRAPLDVPSPTPPSIEPLPHSVASCGAALPRDSTAIPRLRTLAPRSLPSTTNSLDTDVHGLSSLW